MQADGPEINGKQFIDEWFEELIVAEIISVEVDGASEYDLWGKV